MKPLRQWQREAMVVIRGLQTEGKLHALIAACPGSGKTRLTVEVTSDVNLGMTNDCTVIVVPSRALKRQWKKAYRFAGIKAIAEIDNGDLEERRYRDLDLFDPARPVQIMTYQQIAANPDLFAALCARHRVFAVFDELHHADDQATFGESLLTAFNDAVFKLSLSGTPFNTRGGTLAFCNTKEEITEEGEKVRKTIADFTYSYGDALAATGSDDDPMVVRPVTFVRWNGIVEWERAHIHTGVITKKIFNGKHKSDPLTPLIDADLDYFKKMLRAALDELEEVRRHQSNAAMLITARDTDHCDQIAELCRSLGVKDVVIIKYDTPKAQDEIERFEKGSYRVLIAIKMISEGVDITRLRVGVYASNILTRMFFSQFIGRFIRWDDSLGYWQHAVIFIPEHVTLIKYAEEIERMVLDSIIQEPGTGDTPPEATHILVGKSGDGQANGAVERGMSIEERATKEIDEYLARSGLKGRISRGDAIKLVEESRKGKNSEAKSEVQDDSDIGRKNDRLIEQAVRVARRKGREDLKYNIVQTMANQAVGIHKKDPLTPEAILHARAQWLRGFIARLWSGDLNDAA
jgi:superfamily II DNA or RNA helicase